MTALFPHPVPAPATRFGARRQRLLLGCAFGAMLAWTAHGDKASAQAFQGNYSTGFGSDVTRTTGAGTEILTVNSDTAVITWSNVPSTFLPAGNEATFQNGSGTPGGFVVLNRIFTANGGSVRLDGIVNSRVNGVAGGTVLFQNTGGIIIGATARFDVGNLVLTTLSVNETGYGDIVNDGGGFDFNLNLGNGAIEIEAGAQINALTDGSYVAMVAPQILQGGNVQVNGSALYIGASQATFTINDGLFDIEITAGSPVEFPIVHTGSTTGNASTTSPRRIYMAAAPLDFGSGPAPDPVTILLSGTAGFGDASSASVENGQIVLSAGFNIENGAVGGEAKYAEANILITGGTFTSDVFGRATGTAIAETFSEIVDFPSSGLDFQGDLTLEAFEEARLSAIDHPVTVGGNVSLTAFGALDFEEGYGGGFGVQALDVTGGSASITAEDGFSVVVAGNALLDASAVGQFDDVDGVEDPTAGFGAGGFVSLEASDGGAILIDGNVDMRATGKGASEDGRLPEVGGDGFGGQAEIDADDGQIRIDGRLDVDVSGTGSISSGINNPDGPVGATGAGGFINIFAFGNDFTVAGGGSLNASGTGGALQSSDVEGVGGFGDGGFIQMEAGANGAIGLGTVMSVNLTGTGGAGPNGGSGQGGELDVRAFSNGIAGLGNSFTVNTNGIGGAGALGDGGRGTGGFIDIVPSFGEPGPTGQPARVDALTVTLSADGIGGNGPQDGGVGAGGFITVVAESDGGAISIGNISASAKGTGGDGAIGGLGDGGNIVLGTEEGYGGSAILGGNDGGISTLASTGPAVATFGAITLNADGTGGDGTTQAGNGLGGSVILKAEIGQVNYLGGSLLSAVGRGGNATAAAGGEGIGGFAQIVAQTDTLITGSVPATELDASGFGGNGTTGGTGFGGSAFVSAFSGEIDLNGGGLTLRAAGTGGDGTAGAGGVGQAGFAQIFAFSDGILSAGDAFLNVDGTGGDGTTTGGLGDAGSIIVRPESGNSSLTLGNVTAQARGFGGGGTTGGAGDGGNILIGTEFGYGTGSPIATFGGIVADASGTGGFGTATGGVGRGGSAELRAELGQVAFGGNSSLLAEGTGGDAGPSGAGGNGTGGFASIFSRADARVQGSAGTARLSSAGRGGDGAAGGDGTGGTVIIAADGVDSTATGAELTFAGGFEADASGFGGNGTTGAGGDGTGGLVDVFVDGFDTIGGTLGFASAVLTSNGTGGSGTTGGIGRAGVSADPQTELEFGAVLISINGTITGGSASVSARGTGGAGTAGVGGDGFGGTAQIVALNSTSGELNDITPTVITLTSGSLDISARGGAGGTLASGAGAAGGNATAGTTGVVLAETLTGSLTFSGTLTVAADATGGAGGAGTTGAGGRGGNAAAGFVQVGSSSGFGAGVTDGEATFANIQGSASATGGAGGANGGAGGDGAGGALTLLARGGTLGTGDVTFVTNGTGGSGNGVASGGTGTGGQAGALLTARAGTTDGAEVTVGAFSASSTGAGGTGGTAGASEYGNVFVDVRGSTADFASIALTTVGSSAPSDPALAAPVLVSAQDSALAVSGDLDVRSASAVELVAADGTISAGTASIVAPQDITVRATGTGLFSGGGWNLAAAGDVSVTDASFAADSPTIDVASFAASAGGNFTSDSNTVIRASGSILVDATGTATVSGALAGGTIEVRGSDIDLAAADGTTIDLDADDALVTGALTATGDIIFAAGGAASFDNVEAGGRFAGSGATLSISDATAAVIDVRATGGTADVGTLTGSTSLTVNATGNVTFSSLTGGDIVVASSGGGIAGGSANGPTIDFDAAQTAAFTGTIVGNEIRVTSRDIDIGASARLGNADTDLVELEVRQSGQQVVIGGSAQGPGYTLTNAEAGRIRTAALEISASQTGNAASRPPDLVVRDLSLSSTPTPAGSAVGNLQISLTAGEGGGGAILSVEGALALANAGADNGVTLSAPGGRVQVVNPQGSIRVRGAGGLPAGNIEIEAANIWSASQTIIDQLVANPNFEGRNAALLANGGTTEERGYIEGGEILLRVGDTLFVQNSGTADAFAGITVVQNTLTVEPTTSDPIDVYAFGRRINADGTFVTNSPYFREVEFGYGSGYLETAQFNQCVIATGACPDDAPPPPPEFPVGNEVIEGPIEEAEESVPPPNPDRQEFVDTSFASESLLEEPVTSGGDSSIWDEDCEPGEEGAACRAAQARPGDGGN